MDEFKSNYDEQGNPKEETAIVKKPNEELGNAIVHEAEEQYQKELKAAVLRKVVNYKHTIGRLQAKINRIKECIEFNKGKLNCLKSGDFDFDTETGVITFHDKEYNVEWENI